MMKKLVAAFLCLIMLLSLFSCKKGSTEGIDNPSDPDGSTALDTSINSNTNPTSANYDSVLRVYRRIVDSYPIVNQNPRAVAAELGIQDEAEIESFVDLYTSILLFYPGRGQEDRVSPHYKLGCGYSVKDLNGDGVDELVLMNKDYAVMAIFSYADGHPVLLGNYWERNVCWIDGDGLIHNHGSSGADRSTNALYQIADGGDRLELIAEFGTDGHEWIDGVAYTKYYKVVDGEKVSITESECAALVEQYGKALGSVSGAEATKQYSGMIFTSLYTEAEIAMEMYEAAIKGEICVLDERLGEIKLKNCRFPSDNVRLDECEILTKAILDMDQDGINEYVIQSQAKDHIVLRYYDGTVYSYCFDSKNFFNLNTDGSFYWIDSCELDHCTRGYSQIAFEGSSFSIKEIYRIKQTSPYDYGDGTHEYYVDGKQITREEFRDYCDSNCRGKTRAIFSPLDIDTSCEYPISSEKAYELASEFWGLQSGMEEGAAGTRYVLNIVVLEKPNSDTRCYRIGCQYEGYTNHVIDSFYAQPPTSVRIHKELIVNAITGACRDSIDPEFEAEAEVAMEMYEAAIKGEICVVDEHSGEIKLEDCRFPNNNVSLEDYGSLDKAILDIDGDGINEYVIRSPQRDHIIMRYYDGKIYSYGFDFKSLFRLNTDGTFYWYSDAGDSTSNLPTVGLSQITFQDSSIVIREIYKLKNVCEYAEEYYLDGCRVTREEFLGYYNKSDKTWVQFSPFEFSCQYPITAEKAWSIADDYLGNPDGGHDVATGKTYFFKVVITEKPTDGSEYYIVVVQQFCFSHIFDGWQISNPDPLYEFERLAVNAITGECWKYVDPVPDGK
ncbi:MAG: hypothetical protein IKC31_00850 [Clostridia bacterium]|nr:hypothetical protein [Clostridia bacterium]